MSGPSLTDEQTYFNSLKSQEMKSHEMKSQSQLDYYLDWFIGDQNNQN